MTPIMSDGPKNFAIDSKDNLHLETGMIRAFHVKFKIPSHDEPKGLSLTENGGEMGKFRVNRLKEEVREYEEAFQKQDMEGQLDALVDLVYIAIGTAYISGFHFAEAFRRVHEANMKKLRAERAEDSRHGTTYDIIKPADWIPADLSDLAQSKWQVFLSDKTIVNVMATGYENAIDLGEEYISENYPSDSGVQSEEAFQV